MATVHRLQTLSMHLNLLRTGLSIICLASLALTSVAESYSTSCLVGWQERHDHAGLAYGNLTGLTDAKGAQVTDFKDARGIDYLACVDKDRGCSGQRVSSIVDSLAGSH